eukprot:scaffold4387_cov124-Skeletonema_dohrnii-CCMP3373.AAC.1
MYYYALMCNPLMFAAVAILMAAFANRNGIANQGLGQGCLWGRLGWHPMNGTVEDKWNVALVGQFLCGVRPGQSEGQRPNDTPMKKCRTLVFQVLWLSQRVRSLIEPDRVLHLLTPFTNAVVASFVKICSIFKLTPQYKNKMSLRVRIFEYRTLSEGFTMSGNPDASVIPTRSMEATQCCF